MPTDALIGEIIAVTGRLQELMDLEVEYLRTGRVGELTPLQQEKLQFVGAYETRLRRLRDEPTAYESAAPALRQELEAATKRLDQSVERNVKALQAAREVNSRIMGSIVKAAAGDQKPGSGYVRPGTNTRSVPAARRQAVSITLDQRL